MIPKNIFLGIIFIVIPFWATASNITFGELIPRPEKTAGEVFPFSQNQFGVDTGKIEFPADIHVLIHEKSKRIYHKPEFLPDFDDLIKYHNYENGKELHWFWKKYPMSTFKYDAVADEDRGMPGRTLHAIPETDTIIESIIQKVGGERNFLTLLKTWLKTSHVDTNEEIDVPAMQIIGSEYRCKTPRLWTAQEYTSFSSHIINFFPHHISCDEQNDLYLNTHNTRTLLIESPKEQEIIVKVFPVDPGKYKFDTAFLDATPLKLIDPALDYYNIFLIPMVYWEKAPSIRKQKTYTYRIGDKNENSTQVIYPYYEIPVSLKKGQNNFVLEYYSYTPSDGMSFFIVE